MGILIKAQLLVPETIVLNTTDNGWGPPEKFQFSRNLLVGNGNDKSLSKQLGGSFEIRNDPGIVVTIKLKIEYGSGKVSGGRF